MILKIIYLILSSAGIYLNIVYGIEPCLESTEPIITCNSGTIIGKYNKVLNNYVASFKGIPYAKAPVGNKRFENVEPVEKWNDVLLATTPQTCMQYSSRNFPWIPIGMNKSEDCLYLNVWMPVSYNTTKKLPVMVWIHGGGYYAGSASMDVYDGSILASYGDVIVASINYRLGIFGFFNGGSKDSPGNVGLNDQILALKWINANIEYFGGDPGSVTLFGESAGSISISLHIISPSSSGLFHRAIMQSGSAYNPHLVDDFRVSMFKSNAFAEIVGCSTKSLNLFNSSDEVIKCLKEKDATELAQAEDILTSKFPYYFAPSFGGKCGKCSEILPESPITILNSGKHLKVPSLVGINKDEGSIFLTYMMPDVFYRDHKTNLTLIQAKHIIKGLFSTAPEVSSDKVFEFYFRDIWENDSDGIVKIISNAFGDYVFTCPTMYFAEKTKSYMYFMTHRSQKDESSGWIGATHFSEVPYVFGRPMIDTEKYSVEDGKFSSEVMRKWTFFAKFGHPLNEAKDGIWQQFHSSSKLINDLSVSSTNNPAIFPRKEACDFWRPYFEN